MGRHWKMENYCGGRRWEAVSWRMEGGLERGSCFPLSCHETSQRQHSFFDTTVSQSLFRLQGAALVSPFLPGFWGDLVISAADANKCVSLISGQNVLFSPPQIICLNLYLEEYHWQNYLFSHQTDITKPQTIFMIYVNMLIWHDAFIQWGRLPSHMHSEYGYAVLHISEML